MKTLRDIVAERDPDRICGGCMGGVAYCPKHYYYLAKYLSNIEECPKYDAVEEYSCEQCWSREVEE